MNSFRKRVFSWFAVLAVCVITSSAFPKDAEAILINFDGVAGGPTTVSSYTEAGMAFDWSPGFLTHLHMGDNSGDQSKAIFVFDPVDYTHS